MAWFNLNDGLNNLKGQLSSLASGVLTDGIVKDADSKDPNSVDHQQINELELEVQRLRKELDESRGQNYNKNKKIDDEDDESGRTTEEEWSWNVPETSQANNSEKETEDIDALKRRIKILDAEKQDLIQSLEQLDLDCQQTTDRLITLKDEIQTDYNTLKAQYGDLQKTNGAIVKENNNFNSIIAGLKAENERLQNSLKEYENSGEDFVNVSITNPQQTDAKQNEELNALKARCEELEKSSQKCRNDASKANDDLLETQKELEEWKKKAHLQDGKHEANSLTEKISWLNASIDSLKEENVKLHAEIVKFNEKITELRNENSLINNKSIELSSENAKLVNENSILREENVKLKERNRDTINNLKSNYDVEITARVAESKNAFEKKLLKEFKENLTKFVDSEFPMAHIESYESLMESVIKILLDLKWKNETLEKELFDITQEKTKLIQEKNHEIEKLLQNSEILSQEVVTKTQQLKHYETECNELMKNNELLISELDNHKSTSVLQTISESNEDNVLLLEAQLETANQRIKELELTINDMETRKQDVDIEVESELEYIKKQLNLTGTELSESKNALRTLQNQYDQQQEASKNLKAEMDALMTEKDSLNVTVSKITNDYENTEYKYSEMNADMECLIEEVEAKQKHIDDMAIANKKLEMQNINNETKSELLANEIDDLKKELTDEIESKRLLDIQIRNLTEKLQSAKMAETSLKLQHDTLAKEFANLQDNKHSLETRLNQTSADLSEARTKLAALQEENTNLSAKLADYDKLKRSNDDLLQNVNDLNGMNANIRKENDELIRENEEYCNELETSYNSTHLSKNEHDELHEQLKKKNEEHLKIIEQLSHKNEELLTQIQSLLHKQDELQKASTEAKKVSEENLKLRMSVDTLTRRIADQNATDENKESLRNLENVSKENVELKTKLQDHEASLQNQSGEVEKLTAQLNEVIASRNQLVQLVQTKHQENIQYHNEIQRLVQVVNAETEKNTKLLNQEELEKLKEQNEFLREKCEVLARNLLEEQSKLHRTLTERSESAAEKESALTKELDRLKAHLLEVEDGYTKELLGAEQRNQELLGKVNEMELREKNSSNMYTSVSIRANQQVETLQTQLQLVTNQRDEFRKRMSEADDRIAKQGAALTNLQLVLEQFQKDKENIVYQETERIRKQISNERNIQEELRKEIGNLKSQLDESNQGLQAAYRLTDQLENSKQQNNSLKEELQKVKETMTKLEEKNIKLASQTGTKVDKMLIKNLIVGLVSANNNLNKDQTQILKIIATVLDFTQEDNEKINRPNPNSWLGSILHPNIANSSSINQESLSQAFVRFLENESKPRVLPNLLETSNLEKPSSSSNTNTSSTPRSTPPLLSAVVLPTFSDFAQSRNSSSILKDVLKDNS